MKFPAFLAIALFAAVPFAHADLTPEVPAAGTAIRVGGDREAQAVWNARSGEWKSGSSSIDTPLPDGYPPPTPPGALEIKSYPSVRRAEIASQGESGFMPLFRHIERNKIAMTSPVEMDYAAQGLDENTTGTLRMQAVSMSFLYRNPELNGTGSDPRDARIAIRDTAPVTVLSIGGRGSYEQSRVRKDVEKLRTWLAGQKDWVVAGEPRALMYNGPTLTPWRKWLEVQIPVARREDMR